MTKRFVLICALLLAATANAAPFACPEVKTIQRISGEFSWITSEPGWEGFYAVPRFGRGQSSEIKYFKEARWIQLSNLNDAKGIVECDYVGNYNDEIIRFVLSMNQTTKKPTNLNWACEFNPDFPGTQCKCTGEARVCVVEP
jgi:hypothetical protein